MRSKREIDCVPGNNDECCRETLEINFKELGDYEMIYYPLKFNAYVCRGNCYYHSATNAEKPYASLLVVSRNILRFVENIYLFSVNYLFKMMFIVNKYSVSLS